MCVEDPFRKSGHNYEAAKYQVEGYINICETKEIKMAQKYLSKYEKVQAYSCVHAFSYTAFYGHVCFPQLKPCQLHAYMQWAQNVCTYQTD